ncbi:hypothetical protein ACI3L1_07565 [Deinococcus sp. SM5_A1]|uniref:hypothetical protein n=1 Tax=Deinococcus sp. SM5_A1 TaxID=3379094 RepID=UPI00385F0CED
MANSLYALSVVPGAQLAWTYAANQKDWSTPEVLCPEESFVRVHFHGASVGWEKLSAMSLAVASDARQLTVPARANGSRELRSFEGSAHRAIRHSHRWRKSSRHRQSMLFLTWIDLACVHRLALFGWRDVMLVDHLCKAAVEKSERKRFSQIVQDYSSSDLINEFICDCVAENDYSNLGELLSDPKMCEVISALEIAAKTNSNAYLFENELKSYGSAALFCLGTLNLRADIRSIFRSYTQRQKNKYQALYQSTLSAIDIAAYYFLLNKRVRLATQFIHVKLPIHIHPHPPTAPQAPPASPAS